MDIPTSFDEIERPAHYTAGRRIEPIDVIEDWCLPHHLACVIKYIARWGRKGSSELAALRDLEKAAWYLLRFTARQRAAEHKDS